MTPCVLVASVPTPSFNNTLKSSLSLNTPSRACTVLQFGKPQLLPVSHTPRAPQHQGELFHSRNLPWHLVTKVPFLCGLPHRSLGERLSRLKSVPLSLVRQLPLMERMSACCVQTLGLHPTLPPCERPGGTSDYIHFHMKELRFRGHKEPKVPWL